MITLASRGIADIPHLRVFLGEDAVFMRAAAGATAAAGWGTKPSGDRARTMAAKAGVPYLLLEDGFLRSVKRNDPPLSLVVDDIGIYYDASRPSRLEKLIADPLDAEQAIRARALIESWRKARVSKYNHARECEDRLLHRLARYVLVCDQTFGDASIGYGQADKSSFTRMLDAAIAENPDCAVVIKTHPDAFARKKRGYFDHSVLGKNPRIVLVAEDCHPVGLIEGAEAVYTVTSQMGFEALIWGRKVRCFGMPFYAGWGLTGDELPAPARRGKADLEQLVHAALVAYPRYVDPETGGRCEVERFLAHLALQRQMRERFARKVHAVGFSLWKRPILRRFLAGSDIRFTRHPSNLPASATVAVWGSGKPQGLPADSTVLRIEDGFLRSVGLGADLTHPLSWVSDDLGIYYNSRSPSRLDRILQETDFDAGLVARARRLRLRISEAGITKYNIGTVPWKRPDTRRQVILVPGQVEDDASLRLGTLGPRTNIDLVRAVRVAEPDAYLVYKPHPDVAAGLRTAGRDEGEVASWCDEIVVGPSMAHLLEQVDAVHTLTSLTGFEALMRGRNVVCYGQPFYAGWGLTRDMYPIGHRRRRLSLDELVAGSLILYPAYVSRVTGRFTTPERAVEELIAWRAAGGGGLPLWRRTLRPLFSLSKKLTSPQVPWTKSASAAVMETNHGR
ncbi:capsular polysaccharide export protein [Mesorhizobium sp. J18]|uniref:capsular polysaccharide biosynthesis protein n=1 Tax=Mesorhizobium sp. J18 TaxID=935263 RepID=UPI00119AFC36|nr:capsular polysaccharide biosynthesis protein [Mesorhizobium sp. J18]TWG99906.1 capsular polysaccharide export protein [Mesorhizobium sp. J18]